MADEEKIEVPKKFEELVKKIEEMSVLDLAELVKILEKKFGVSAAAPVMAAPAAVAERLRKNPALTWFWHLWATKRSK